MLFLSFCSFFDLKENEDVVEAALKANNDRFTLEHCLPSWTHRGEDVFQGGRFDEQREQHSSSKLLALKGSYYSSTLSIGQSLIAFVCSCCF